MPTAGRRGLINLAGRPRPDGPFGLLCQAGSTFSTVGVTLSAHVGPFVAGMRTAATSVSGLSRSINGLEKKHAAGLQTLGRAGLGIGAAFAAGAALSVRAAIQYESAFAGVRKTVEATEEQYAQLSGALRDMATEMPSTAVELANIAASAGQLGVKRQDIIEFTRTIAMLGETTNVVGEEGAAMFARFLNIFQTRGDDIDNVASALVAVGNAGASTEQEILEISTRMAAAGKQAGLSEADILGFGNAIISTGSHAEAGGTAFQKVFRTINDAVLGANDNLEGFAKVAGMSSEEFRRAYQEDAAGAISSFVEGLGRIQNSGGSTTQTLQDLGLRGEILARVLGAAASAGDLMGESVELANDELKRGRALTEEYEKRVETTAAQMEIARNQVVELAMGFGENLLPVVNGVIDRVQGLATGFGALPGPIRSTIGGIAGLVGPLAAVSGGLALFQPKLVAAQKALTAMGGAGPTAARGLGFLGKAGMWAAIIYGLGEAIAFLSVKVEEWRHGTTDLDEATSAMLDLAEGSRTAFAALDEATAGNLADFGDDFRDAMAGGVDATFDLMDSLEGVDDSLANLVKSGNIEGARQGFLNFAEAAGIQGRDIAKLRELFPEYNRELLKADNANRNAGTAAGENADAQGVLGGALDETEVAAQEAADAMDSFTDSIDRAHDAAFGALTAEADVQEAVAALSASFAENGDTIDASTEAGRSNIETLDALGSAMGDQIAKQVELASANGLTRAEISDLNTSIEAARLKFIDWATQAGLSRGAAELFASQLFNLETAALEAGAADPTIDVQMTGDEDVMARLRTLGDQINAVRGTLGLAPLAGAELTQQAGRANIQRIRQRGLLPSAEGNLFGDSANSHVAQIAPAGAMRLWAEPETQGESYIPHANDHRRGRARSIWLETGRILGYDPSMLALMGGATSHAMGSVSGGRITVQANSPDIIEALGRMSAASAMSGLGAGGGGPLGGGNLVALGRQLIGEGFRVGEHPSFGGVQPVHTRGSAHYAGRAIDVNWGPPGQSPGEMRALDALRGRIPAGFKVLWRVKGHFDHMHIANAIGRILRFAGGGIATDAEGERNALEELAGTGLSPAELIAIRKGIRRQEKAGQRSLRELARQGYDPEGMAHLGDMTQLVRGALTGMSALGLSFDRIEPSGFFNVAPRPKGLSRREQFARAIGILDGPRVRSTTESERIKERFGRAVEKWGLDAAIPNDASVMSLFARGGMFNPHVRDMGGPLLPGFTFNGTGRSERVVSNSYGGPQVHVDVNMPVSISGNADRSTVREMEAAAGRAAVTVGKQVASLLSQGAGSVG